MRMATDRRDFLISAGAAVLAGAAGGVSKLRAAPPPSAYLIPGYKTAKAYRRGQPLIADRRAARALPRGYDGPVTMITRIALDADSVERALFPIVGHAITLDPARSRALFVGKNDDAILVIDPASLDLTATARPHADGFLFGDHVAFTADGKTVFAVERRDPGAPYSGRPADHFGRISVRDADTLRVLDSFDCAGIAPHDIALFDGGRHLAVANYGSTDWPTDVEAPTMRMPYGVEPSLTIIGAASGRLAHKEVAPKRLNEVQHVAVGGLDRIAVLQSRLAAFDDAQLVLRGRDDVYYPEAPDGYGRSYLPVPLLHYDLGAATPKRAIVMTDDPLLMQRGQTIVYEPTHDEMLVTYVASHTVIAFDAASGAVKHVTRTDRIGLRRPRGLALHPDGVHYVVSGSWENVFVFRRGSHDLVRKACRYELLFDHSHLAIV